MQETFVESILHYIKIIINHESIFVFQGLAALHYCTMRNNLQGVKALLSAGATIDLKDMRSGRTPLFHALDNNHTAVVQTLLKAGAVANITNYAGQTPLPIVAEKFIFQSIRRETM